MKRRDVVLVALIALAAAAIALFGEDDRPLLMSGTVRVIDGDTLILGNARIRLEGIDAPELGQNCRAVTGDWPCGQAARTHLVLLVDGQSVACRTRGRDRYERTLARCDTPVRNLNAAMVEAGYAVAFGDYARQEETARRGRLGLWQGSFDLPSDWRQMQGGLADEPHGSGVWTVIRNWIGIGEGP